MAAWIARIEADGMKLTMTFTLPAELGGSSANTGENSGRTKVPPRAANGGLAGTRGRSIRLSVTVRMAWEKREVEPAESVPREQRGEVWARWLAEGRYRSGAELARAAGVSMETVSAAVRGR